jgi:hypothetical protein
MKKIVFLLILIVTSMSFMISCTDSTPPTPTDFEHMLSYIPYSFLEKYDIFYGNPGVAKQLNGAEDVKSLEAFNQLTEAQRKPFVAAWNETASVFPAWNNADLAGLVGFDTFAFDRVIEINSAPPHISYIASGNFDKALIAEKLTALGYTKIDYGVYSYYAKGDDFQPDIFSPLGRIVLGGMNRVAVMDNLLIISPTTGDVTGVLDVMDGNTPSVMDNAVCQTLADSLGDPLVAAITTPDRIIFNGTGQDNTPVFDYSIPDDWGQLHTYEMAALGYRADGNKRFFDIALYYADKNAATADGQEISKRMNSYTLTLLTQQQNPTAFTDMYQPGEPVVTPNGDGAVLKISCQLILEERRGIIFLMGGTGMPVRDLLFLSPDPTPYLVK